MEPDHPAGFPVYPYSEHLGTTASLYVPFSSGGAYYNLSPSTEFDSLLRLLITPTGEVRYEDGPDVRGG